MVINQNDNSHSGAMLACWLKIEIKNCRVQKVRRIVVVIVVRLNTQCCIFNEGDLMTPYKYDIFTVFDVN